MTHAYDREGLREWADLAGHTDDYAKCHRCKCARQDCECTDDEEEADKEEDDDEEPDDERTECPTCGGWGAVTLTSSRFYGCQQYRAKCNECGGSGKV